MTVVFIHLHSMYIFIFFWCIIGIVFYQTMPIVHAMPFMRARQCQICRQCQLFKQTMPNMHAMPFSLLDNAKCACNAICVRQTMPNVHTMPFMRLRQCQICRKCQLCTQCHFWQPPNAKYAHNANCAAHSALDDCIFGIVWVHNWH